MTGMPKKGPRAITPKLSLAEKMAQFQRRKESSGVDWSKVDSTVLKASILAAISNGAALMFSAAQGGRGVCVTLFDDGDREKLYAVDSSEFQDHLSSVVEMYTTGSEDYTQAVV